MTTPLYKELAGLVSAHHNCIDRNHGEMATTHKERITNLVKEHMPSGSGFDTGTEIDLDASNDDKLVFNTSFHHMDEHGYYDGWTHHKVVIRPSFIVDMWITIGGLNRNDIKDYIQDCFYQALRVEVK